MNSVLQKDFCSVCCTFPTVASPLKRAEPVGPFWPLMPWSSIATLGRYAIGGTAKYNYQVNFMLFGSGEYSVENEIPLFKKADR
jgi:hypothetical protein